MKFFKILRELSHANLCMCKCKHIHNQPVFALTGSTHASTHPGRTYSSRFLYLLTAFLFYFYFTPLSFLFCLFALRLERTRCSQRMKLGTSCFKCYLGWFLCISMVRGFTLSVFTCSKVAWPSSSCCFWVCLISSCNLVSPSARKPQAQFVQICKVHVMYSFHSVCLLGEFILRYIKETWVIVYFIIASAILATLGLPVSSAEMFHFNFTKRNKEKCSSIACIHSIVLSLHA